MTTTTTGYPARLLNTVGPDNLSKAIGPDVNWDYYVAKLTKDQRECLDLIATGLSHQAIAIYMGITTIRARKLAYCVYRDMNIPKSDSRISPRGLLVSMYWRNQSK